MSKQGVSAVTAILSLGIVGACVDTSEPEEVAAYEQGLLEEFVDAIPNNFPIPNSNGAAASYSVTTAPRVALDNEFFTPQGTNGRDCGSCHAAEDGWSITPTTVTLMFLASAGQDPLFANNLDTDTPSCDMSTVAKRWNCTTMLRQGKFTRKVAPPATRDYDVTAVSDPFGISTTSSLWFFRRPLPTANFKSHTVMWDGANTVGTNLRDGLIKQARGNVTGAQQGAPASDATIFAIVDYEMGIGHAQTHGIGTGTLQAQGAHGGPEAAVEQPLVAGRFDLFDAWKKAGSPHRRAVYRGQEIFNNVNAASGRRCGGCHNAANNGQNVAGTLFDVGASNPEHANADMAVFTITQRGTGVVKRSTDPGQGIRNGAFADINKFKTPNIRGLSARAPYFHNGIARTLREVVEFYEESLGFQFTAQEEDDLVAFLEAL
ncbi:MAG: hypothetical protein HOV81_18055 [Kofleriaceae bacterium]|nr:hypothetical protein [Kofleriaceae bacterium]